jgi:hypothetical protein
MLPHNSLVVCIRHNYHGERPGILIWLNRRAGWGRAEVQ